MKHLGRIIQWPQGYAMTLDVEMGAGSVIRCCDGHESPELAKHHGLTVGVEMMLEAANRDIAAWSAPPAPESATDPSACVEGEA